MTESEYCRLKMHEIQVVILANGKKLTNLAL